MFRRLSDLLAHRAEVQHRLETDFQEGVDEATRTFEQLQSDLGQWRQHIFETAGSEREIALQQIRPGFEEELSKAHRAMETDVSAFNARSNSMMNVARGRLEESRWLAETLVESTESKARAQFDVVRKSIEKQKAEIDAMAANAATILENARHQPLPAVDQSAGVPARASDGGGELGVESSDPGDASGEPVVIGDGKDVKTLLGELQQERAAVEENLELLHRRVNPQVLSLPGLFSGAIAGAGAASLIMLWLVESPTLGGVAQVAGIAFVLTLIVMAVLRVLARRRVPAAAASFASALAAANTTAAQTRARAHADFTQHVRQAHLRRDQELGEAQNLYLTARREVDQRRDVTGPQLRAQHLATIEGIQQRYNTAVQEIDGEHHQRTSEAQNEHDRQVREAAEARDLRLDELAAARDAGWSQLEEHWHITMAEIKHELSALQDRARSLWPQWHALDGRVAPESLPPAAQFGVLTVDLARLPGGLPDDDRLPLEIPACINLPAVLDLLGKGSLLLEHPTEARPQAIAALNAVMLRLLTTFPPGKVRFTILDPVGLGESFAAFMHLADYEPALVGDRIWTDARHIEQKLADLTEHMETVIQKYLRNEYDCIQDYNAEAGEIAEPFRFLVIADFPANFSESAVKRLMSILSSGSRCGVFTLIAADMVGGVEAGVRARGGSSKMPHWVPLQEIERASNTLVWEEQEAPAESCEADDRQETRDFAPARFEWKDPDFGQFPLMLDHPPSPELLTEKLHELGRQAKDSTRVQVPFSAVSPQADALWSRSAAHEISVPLGRSGARKVQELMLGRGTAQHALIAGRTGAGKSNLLHVLISNAALWYSPQEVELYLVDFKKGVEFKSYAMHNLPHARVIAIESEREFGLSVLRRLDVELTRRGTLFRDAGVQDVAGYRRERPGAPMPRILLIVDEFQEFFVEDDRIAQDSSLLLDRLVRQGRAFGMHVVLGSQTLGGAYSIARSTIGQMAVRIALQCSEADCYLIMSEDNNAPRLLSRPGEAIYNDASGMVEGNSPFQVVFLPDQVRDQWLPRVAQSVASRNMSRLPAPIIFEGNLPARLEASQPVLEAIAASATDNGAPPVTIWLGEPVSIQDPTSFDFQRQSGSNLLIVGQQDEAALALLTGAAFSLGGRSAAAGSNGELHQSPLVLFDGSAPGTSLASVLQELSQRLPSRPRIVQPRQAADIVKVLAEELERREREEQSGQGGSAPLYILIYGLHRFRDLRKPDDFAFGMDDRAASPGAQFTRLLRDGPPLGIHTIAWCDSVANLDRTLERSALREFEARILFQMSATDSTHLMDTPQASTLGRYRAILYREDAGTAERFRPWALPDAEVRRRVLGLLMRPGPARAT